MYRFRYEIPAGDGEPVHRFEGNLERRRCIGVTDGEQCHRWISIGLPYCAPHMVTEAHLRVQPSLIPDAGKGLFAYDPSQPEGALVFERHALICMYGGEIIDEEERFRRYRHGTAPYGCLANGNRMLFEDAALVRGVGAMANHAVLPNAKISTTISQRGPCTLRALRDIFNNTEILVNYNAGAFGDDNLFEFDGEHFAETVHNFPAH